MGRGEASRWARSLDWRASAARRRLGRRKNGSALTGLGDTDDSAEASIDARSIIRWRPLAIVMLCSGAAMIEIGLSSGWVQTRGSRTSVDVVAATFVALAALTARVELAAYRRFTGLVIVASICAITVLASSFVGTSLIPVFYVWPLLAAAYLLSRRALAGTAALSSGGCAAALNALPGDFPIADYLILLSCGAVVVLTVRVLSESLNRTMEALRLRALTDPLTGLLNRRGFDRLLDRQFRRARFEGCPISSVVIDIDHFKAINDTFGHPVGDAALKHFADLLRESCRAGDIIGRLGGEEFAIVMPGATTEQALARADEFAARLRASSLDPGVTMTASIGIATDAGQPTCSDMLDAADAAVYVAKRAGRDRTVISPAS